MTISPLKSQPNPFQFSELLPGLVICQAQEDIHNWGNSENNEPAFLVYIGYHTPQERDEWIYQLQAFWKIEREHISYRRANRIGSGYWWELKVRGMKRYSDLEVFDLEHFSESYHYGLDFLQYLIEMRLEAAAHEEMVTTRIITQC
jgi:hypothetical protein